MSQYGYSSLFLAAAATGGFGAIPAFPVRVEEPRHAQAALRRQQHYDDLVRAAEALERRDRFARQQQEPQAAQTQKRSRLKRALNKVLTAVHLKKKPQAPAPAATDAETRQAALSLQHDVAPLRSILVRPAVTDCKPNDSVPCDESAPLLKRRVRFALDDAASPDVSFAVTG